MARVGSRSGAGRGIVADLAVVAPGGWCARPLRVATAGAIPGFRTAGAAARGGALAFGESFPLAFAAGAPFGAIPNLPNKCISQINESQRTRVVQTGSRQCHGRGLDDHRSHLWARPHNRGLCALHLTGFGPSSRAERIQRGRRAPAAGRQFRALAPAPGSHPCLPDVRHGRSRRHRRLRRVRLAPVSKTVRPVSNSVRRTPPIVSANLRRKPP